MCGVGFVIANNTTAKQVEVLEQLMYCSAVRGYHSTGIFTKGGWVKDAVQPYDLATKNKDYSVLVKEYAGVPANQGGFIVYHNRHATMGAINADNAHPFEHGHITMVHNGVVRNLSLLPDSALFAVDSDNVCYALNEWGVEKTIANLHAAFVLIWTDSRDDTLHIIRNSERPFYLQRISEKQWYGASEEDMLKWVLRRNKVTFTASEGFELETLVEYVFDSTGELIIRHKRKGYTPPVVSTSTTYNRYASSTTSTTPSSAVAAVTATTSTIPTVGGKTDEKKSRREKKKEKKNSKKGMNVIPWGGEEVGSKTTHGTAPTSTTISTSGTTENSRGLVSSTKPVIRFSHNTDANLLTAGHDLKAGDELEFVITSLTDSAGYVKLDGYAVGYLEDVVAYGVPATNQKFDEYKVYKSIIVNAYFVNDDLRIVVDSQNIEYVREDEEIDDAYVDVEWCKCGWCEDSIYESDRAYSEQQCEDWGYFLCYKCLETQGVFKN